MIAATTQFAKCRLQADTLRPQAGALAGTTVDLSLYPIDTIKTRLQSGSFPSPSSTSTSTTKLLSPHLFRSIYAGVGSAFIGSAPSAALFFVTYDTLKRSLSPVQNAQSQSPYVHMLAASVGEIAACAVRVPTEVVKQRTQAAQAPSSLAALRQILSLRQTHGAARVGRELYRGFGITVMREVPFTVIQFPLWEALKGWRRRQTGKKQTSGLESAVIGSVAGAVAAGLTTPLDVLKTRMMLAKQTVKAHVLVRQIVGNEGWRVFGKGLGPRVAWISGGGAIFLGSYEWAYNKLEAWNDII